MRIGQDATLRSATFQSDSSASLAAWQRTEPMSALSGAKSAPGDGGNATFFSIVCSALDPAIHLRQYPAVQLRTLSTEPKSSAACA